MTWKWCLEGSNPASGRRCGSPRSVPDRLNWCIPRRTSARRLLRCRSACTPTVGRRQDELSRSRQQAPRWPGVFTRRRMAVFQHRGVRQPPGSRATGPGARRGRPHRTSRGIRDSRLVPTSVAERRTHVNRWSPEVVGSRKWPIRCSGRDHNDQAGSDSNQLQGAEQW
jgi:hypothetical protein